MKYKKNLMPKIVAGVALFAIVIWIVWTGVLVIASTFTQNQGTQISEAELQKYLDTLPEATVNGSWSENTSSWEIDILPWESETIEEPQIEVSE